MRWYALPVWWPVDSSDEERNSCAIECMPVLREVEIAMRLIRLAIVISMLSLTM